MTPEEHCSYCHRITAVHLGRHGIFCPEGHRSGCPECAGETAAERDLRLEQLEKLDG